MRFLVGALFTIAVALCSRLPASASCTYPNTLSNGQIVDANALNANLTAISLCVVNLQPSSIVPTSSVNATFGGTLPYTFPAGLTVNGTTTASTLAVTGNLSVSGSTALGSLTAAGPIFSGTVVSTAISNSGLITTGSLSDTGAAVFGSSGYVQINSLTPSQCVNTASNDVLGSQPCNYFTLNGLQPSVSLTSTGNTLSVTPSGSTVDLEVLNSSYVTSALANTKITAGNVSAVTGGTAKTGLPFTSTGYYCSLGASAAGGTSYALSYQVNTSSQATFYANPSVTVSYVCVGT